MIRFPGNWNFRLFRSEFSCRAVFKKSLVTAVTAGYLHRSCRRRRRTPRLASCPSRTGPGLRDFLAPTTRRWGASGIFREQSWFHRPMTSWPMPEGASYVYKILSLHVHAGSKETVPHKMRITVSWPRRGCKGLHLQRGAFSSGGSRLYGDLGLPAPYGTMPSPVFEAPARLVGKYQPCKWIVDGGTPTR